jgi:hypothetical protein
VLSAQPAPLPGALPAAPSPPQTAAFTAPGTPSAYRLTDERKRELVLRYLNRLVDILF